MTESVTSFAIGFLIAMTITLAVSYPSWLRKQVTLDATKSGIVGLAIGLTIIVLVVLNESAPWTIGRVMATVAMVSFFGPFGTQLSARRPGSGMTA